MPVIDISPFASPASHDDTARAACAVAWDKAMTEVGFALIVGHGVDKDTVEAMRSGFRSFFEKQLDYKKQFAYGPYGNPQGGYTPMGNEAVTRSQDEHGGLGAEEAKVAKAPPLPAA